MAQRNKKPAAPEAAAEVPPAVASEVIAAPAADTTAVAPEPEAEAPPEPDPAPAPASTLKVWVKVLKGGTKIAGGTAAAGRKLKVSPEVAEWHRTQGNVAVLGTV